MNNETIDQASRMTPYEVADLLEQVAKLTTSITKLEKENKALKDYMEQFQPFKLWQEEDKTDGVSVQLPPKENEG